MGVFDVLSKVTGGGEDGSATDADDAAGDGSKSVDDGFADPDDHSPTDFREGANALAGRSDVPELDFTEASLADLDAIATGNHPVDDPVAYGSYLGETLVRTFDGEWVRDDGWAVAVDLGDDRTTVAVFDAARMALDRGPVFERVAERLHEQGDPTGGGEDDEDESADVSTTESWTGTADGESEDEPTTDEDQTESVTEDGSTGGDAGDEGTTGPHVPNSPAAGERGDDATVTAGDREDDPPAVADSRTDGRLERSGRTSDGDSEDASGEPTGDRGTDRSTTTVDADPHDDVAATADPGGDDGDAPTEVVDDDSSADRSPVEDHTVVIDAGSETDESARDDTVADDASTGEEDEGSADTDEPSDDRSLPGPDRVAQADDEPADGPGDDEEPAKSGDVDRRPISEEIADIGPSVRPTADSTTDDATASESPGSASDAPGDTVEASATETEVESDVASGDPDDRGPMEENSTDVATDAKPDADAHGKADVEVATDAEDGGGPAPDPVADVTKADREAGPAEPKGPADDKVNSPGTESDPSAESADEDAAARNARSDYEAVANEFTDAWADRDFDYSAASLARLDRFLDDQWDDRFPPGSLDDSPTDPAEGDGPLVQVGAYVGEVLVRHYDGEWVPGEDGEPAVAVAGRHGREEIFDVFDATRRSLIHPARIAYEVDALAHRLDVERSASGAVESGFAVGDGGPGTAASSADVITTILDRAERFVDAWPAYDLDYRPASLARLDNLVDRELDTDAYPAATLGDWTDPDTLRLADTAAGIGAYYAAVLVRHLGAQWEIGEEVALAVEGPGGQTRVRPFPVAVDRLRGRGKLMLRYDRVYDAVKIDSRGDE